jgi:hypothetical protein
VFCPFVLSFFVCFSIALFYLFIFFSVFSFLKKAAGFTRLPALLKAVPGIHYPDYPPFQG